MERNQSNAVSRDLIRAVLESRDHRHTETHAVLLALYESLVAELVEQGILSPGPLAERLGRVEAAIAPDPHGSSARSMLEHVVSWLRGMAPGLPPAHPERWAPPVLKETE